jgi:hypothetical protein
MSSTSRLSRGRAAIAALIVVLAFGAAFAVRKATAGGTSTPAAPAPFVLHSTAVPASGVALPVVALPALAHPPRPAAPAPSAPSSTPAAPTPAPAAPSTPAPSTPAAPPSSGGGGKGPVLVG